MRRAKGNPCACRRGSGLELTCVLFFLSLSLFFPPLPFPVLFFFLIYFFFYNLFFQSSPESPSDGERYKESSRAGASAEWGKRRAGDGGKKGGGMSIGKSEKQTWGMTVYLVRVCVCVCTCWWSLQWSRGNIFRNFPMFEKEEKGGASFVGKICSNILVLL